jgi:hypothetical protein
VTKLLPLITLLAGCGFHGHGHMHWDETNQQDLICDATQERLGGVGTWDGGRNWTVYDRDRPVRTYVDKQIAMQRAEASLGGECPKH